MNQLQFNGIQPFPSYSGANLSDIHKQNKIIEFMNIFDSHPEYDKNQICKVINISPSTFDRYCKDQEMQSPYRYKVPFSHKKVNPDKFGEQYKELVGKGKNITNDDLVCKNCNREFKSSNGIKTHLRTCSKKIIVTAARGQSQDSTKSKRNKRITIDENETGKGLVSPDSETITKELFDKAIDEELVGEFNDIIQQKILDQGRKIKASERIKKAFDEHVSTDSSKETVDEDIAKHFPPT